ncbi:uncharacterized protein LOC111099178 [Crassostrea virginica]
MPLIAVLIAVFGLPACAPMPTSITTSTLLPPLKIGCIYDGKYYTAGEVIHRTGSGDCVETLTCKDGYLTITISQGCTKVIKREATENLTPSANEPKTTGSLVPSLPLLDGETPSSGPIKHPNDDTDDADDKAADDDHDDDVARAKEN